MTAHHNFSAYFQPLNDDLKTALKQTKVWTEESVVSLERLSQIIFYHYPLEGGPELLQGEMIVLDTVAPYVAKVFDALKEHQFRIHQAKSIHHYLGDDVKSMEDNNSSAFNFRKISGKDKLSIHSYGVAIDINPIQNPFIDPSAPEPNYQPLNAKDYLDRSQVRTGMIDGKVIQIFKENGFPTWGGNWHDPIDYHHFEIPRDIAEKLASLPKAESKEFFDQYVVTVNNS